MDVESQGQAAPPRRHEPAVALANVSKKYRLFDTPGQRVKEALHPFGRRYHREFWALRDVTVDVPRGATVGVIGRNGSGKSTLLQIITGVLRPTTGSVVTRGRISALLELGTGFNQQLTGRQNVMLNGAVQGYSSAEMEERIPLIREFADIGDFFDQPVKLYSSGMFVRLAFAAAINVDPDILIVDEALAVGDAKFQYKCFAKFHEFQSLGKTILLVSHSTDAIVRHCDHAVLLEGGLVLEQGEPKDVASHYLDLLFTGTKRTFAPEPVVEEADFEGFALVHYGTRYHAVPSSLTQELDPIALAGSLRAWHLEGTSVVAASLDDLKEAVAQRVVAGGPVPTARVAVPTGVAADIDAFVTDGSGVEICTSRRSYNKSEYRYGDRRAEVIDYLLVAAGESDVRMVPAGERLDIYVKIRFHEAIPDPMTGIAIKTVDGIDVYGINTKGLNVQLSPIDPSIAVFKWSVSLDLASGDYFVDVGCAEYLNGESLPLDRRYGLAHVVVHSDVEHGGLTRLSTRFERLL